MEEGNPSIEQPEPDMTRAERRRLKRLNAKEERRNEKKQEERKGFLGKAVLLGAVLLIAGAIGFFVYSSNGQAKSLDSFAQCLSEKGAVIYGNDRCQYTQRQKSMFGSSFHRLKYVVCDEKKELCDQKQITITPTWEIEGNMVREVQSLKRLSELTGCKLE